MMARLWSMTLRKNFVKRTTVDFQDYRMTIRALEGEINYSMVSGGFSAIFGNKTLKLEVTIYDRALNASNTMETPEFRLEEI